MGHKVTVFERAPKPGGLLMYGIPNMKLDKRVVQRRLEILSAEGIDFICNVEVGKDVTAQQLKSKFDAVLVATGSTVPRDLHIPGRNLKNIHFAMDFLTQQQQALFNQNPTLMEDAIAFRTPFKGNKDWKLDTDGSFLNVGGKKVYMCPYDISYLYICVFIDICRFIFVLIPVYMCPYDICPHTGIYVSSYRYICVLTYVCVVYICPHTKKGGGHWRRRHGH